MTDRMLSDDRMIRFNLWGDTWWNLGGAMVVVVTVVDDVSTGFL